jgi:NADH-quinone oxidoreductase subunit J
MELSALIFLILAAIIVISSASVLMVKNPIYAAFCLAITMVAMGFMYFGLSADFIAGVQLIVYAGAVMVLFVMVLMLFDLQHEGEAFSKGAFSAALKLFCALFITGAVAISVRQSVLAVTDSVKSSTPAEQVETIKLLATKLFTQYVFAFEALGILLLVIAIGVVAVARSRGGTHARH